jgi:predicted Zn-dependent protease
MRHLLTILFCLGLAACQTAPSKPMKGHEDASQLSPKEQRLWHAAREFDQGLRKADFLYESAELQEYVQAVMDRLYPEYEGAVTARVLDSPSLNAFALPNGSIYINTGMLARLDNEAQMATVLAHEGIHFTGRHGWRQRRNIKNSALFATGFGILTGIPLLGDLMASSSIYGFSQGLEREADVQGFNRLQKAGYDVSQSPLAFEHLLAEVEALEIKEPFFFSSHPKLTERIESFKELAGTQEKETASDYRAGKEYLSHVKDLRVILLKDYLEMSQYQSVLLILEREGAFDAYPPSARFYLGEAYRLRGGDDDIERAAAAYEAAVEEAPEYAPSYRALGMLHMKEDRADLAISFFSKYLELNPGAADRGYVEQYLSNLKRSGDK